MSSLVDTRSVTLSQVTLSQVTLSQVTKLQITNYSKVVRGSTNRFRRKWVSAPFGVKGGLWGVLISPDLLGIAVLIPSVF